MPLHHWMSCCETAVLVNYGGCGLAGAACARCTREAHTAAVRLQQVASCTGNVIFGFPWSALLTSGPVLHGLYILFSSMSSDPVLTAWAAYLQALSKLQSARRQSTCMVMS